MTKGRMISPNDLFKAAKEHMLDGREPSNKQDWLLTVNFFAANIDKPLADSATKLICLILEVPLEENEIEEIVKFQMARGEA